MKNVTAIIDGQAGSCGKGKFIGYFALQQNIEAAVANNMPNAGHTFVLAGTKRIFRHIPVSSANVNTQLFIGAGSVIDMDALEKEYEDNKDILEGREIIVHPAVPIIKKEHREYERDHIRSGSTFKGGAACMCEKIMRDPNVKFFKEFKTIKADKDYHEKLYSYLKIARNVLIEGSQGCDLDINHSGHYPYTTSRQISVAQMFADSGIATQYLKKVLMVIRPFPIRISNKNELGIDIYTGDYGSSEELSFENLNISSAIGTYPTPDMTEENGYCQCSEEFDLTEYTTVTNQRRRIFDIDINLLKKNVELNKPDEICLNFFQYLNSDYKNVSGSFENLCFNRYTREYLNWLEDELSTPITMLGTGPDNKSLILRKKV